MEAANSCETLVLIYQTKKSRKSENINCIPFHTIRSSVCYKLLFLWSPSYVLKSLDKNSVQIRRCNLPIQHITRRCSTVTNSDWDSGITRQADSTDGRCIACYSELNVSQSVRLTADFVSECHDVKVKSRRHVSTALLYTDSHHCLPDEMPAQEMHLVTK